MKNRQSSRVDFGRLFESVLIGCAATLIGTVFILAWINTAFGIEEQALIATFSVDEDLEVRRVLHNVRADDLDPRGFFNYGYLYQGLAIKCLDGLGRLGYDTSSVKLAALVLRSISILSLGILVVLILLFGRTFSISTPVSWVFALLLVSTPSVLRWSQHIHPDLLQAALILFALYIVFPGRSPLRLAAAATAAGMAFGTKYSGVFVLAPILMMSLPMAFDKQGSTTRVRRFVRPLVWSMIALALFLAAWLITNPYVSSNLDEVFSDIAWEKAHIARGHFRAESTDPTLWFMVLFNELGITGSVLVLTGMIGVGRMIVRPLVIGGNLRAGLRELMLDGKRFYLLALSFYCGSSLAFLMIEVNMRRPRYTLAILPSMLVLSAIGGFHLLKRMKLPFHILIPAITLVALIPSTLESVKETIPELAAGDVPTIMAGKWIRETYPPNVRILADVGSYIPPIFTNSLLLFGIREQYIESFHPDLLVINRSMTGRWFWKKPGTRFSEAQFELHWADDAEEITAAYRRRLSGSSPWQTVFENSDVVILQRSGYQIKN